MARLGEMKKLGPSTLVWAVGMREWVRLDSLRALLWFACSEGTPALTPTARGEACVDLLTRLVTLRPSVDAEGAPVRPVPKAKRVLCGPRTLPHIAQALLAGSPKLVDGVAGLLMELIKYNPKALVKLYMTGVYFFVLGYNGCVPRHATPRHASPHTLTTRAGGAVLLLLLPCITAVTTVNTTTMLLSVAPPPFPSSPAGPTGRCSPSSWPPPTWGSPSTPTPRPSQPRRRSPSGPSSARCSPSP